MQAYLMVAQGMWDLSHTIYAHLHVEHKHIGDIVSFSLEQLPKDNPSLAQMLMYSHIETLRIGDTQPVLYSENDVLTRKFILPSVAITYIQKPESLLIRGAHFRKDEAFFEKTMSFLAILGIPLVH